jgi:hypothetical protein
MCFRRSRYWDERAGQERAGEGRSERLWDLFYRETERSEAPAPVLESEEEPVRDEVPAGAER